METEFEVSLEPMELNSMRALGNVFAIPEYSAKELRKIREKLALSQSQFAKLTGYQLRTIQSWESLGKPITPSEPALRMYQILDKPGEIEKHAAEIRNASRRRGRQIRIHE